MSNTTIKYIIYNHAGSGRRGHHFGPENNFIEPAHGHVSPGDQISAIAFPTLKDLRVPDPVMGNVAAFAFMSVHGAADGNHLYTSPGVYTVNVGHNNIDILVVYIQGQWELQADSVVWIDAFNVGTGHFSDSDFLESTLSPDNGQPHPSIEDLGFDGNNTGVFSMNPEFSNWPNANVLTTVDGAPFLVLERCNLPNNLIHNRDLTVQLGEIWFAFFQERHRPPHH
jgi:hypothetical protein